MHLVFHFISILLCDLALLPLAFVLVDIESASVPKGLFVAWCVGFFPMIAADFLWWILLKVCLGGRTLIAMGRSRWAWARVVLLPFALLPHAVPDFAIFGLAVMALLSFVCLADALVSSVNASRMYTW